MTCPHCGFENLDSNQACFRCGQDLDLSHVDVEPPRAADPPVLRRFLARLARHRRPSGDSQRPALGMLLLSLVPGLGHLLLGEPLRAALAVVLYAAAALVSVLDAPVTSLADWILQPRWLPVSVHAWVMADAYAARRRQGGSPVRRPELLLVTLGAMALLFTPGFLGLIPGGGSRVRLYMALESALLEPGDILRLDRHPEEVEGLRRGTVVLYPAAYGDEMLAQIVALPGSRVDWKPPLLRVDTRPVPVPAALQAGLGEAPEARLTLQAGEYLVFPAAGFPHSLQDLVLRAETIHAVAVEVVEPPARRRFLDTR